MMLILKTKRIPKINIIIGLNSVWRKKEKKKPQVQELDDGNDTEDSSVELKAEEDGDAAFLKKEEEKPITVEKVENGNVSDEEKGGRNQSRSIYKTDGYNLDLDLTDSDEESVDCSDDENYEGDGIAIHVANTNVTNNHPNNVANNQPNNVTNNNTNNHPNNVTNNNTNNHPKVSEIKKNPPPPSALSSDSKGKKKK